jgi:phospholipid-binding lipoprotein MlaA
VETAMPAFDLSRTWRALLLCTAMALGGCATTGERNPADPWERTNRQAFAFNEAADRGVLRPTAKAYKAATPDWFRTGVGNFFENLSSPATIVNSLLQGKPGDAGEQTLRFFLNTTLGIGGVLDPATAAELANHDEDFGQTLGSWGVPSGPFLMVPLLGPSTVRDFPSDLVDRFLRPLFWFNIGSDARWGALVLDIVDTRARLLPLDAALARAYDRYGFIRDAFLQRRLYQVFDGNPPESLLLEPLDDFDEDLEDPELEAEPEAVAPEVVPDQAPD